MLRRQEKELKDEVFPEEDGQKEGQEKQFHSRTIGHVAADPCPSHIPSWSDMADLSP